MIWRATLGVLLCFGQVGCSASNGAASQPGATPELNGAAGAPTAESPARGVGSRVWFDSSVRMELEHFSAFDPAEGNVPPSGDSVSACRQLDSASLTDSQRATLEAITLIALNDACTADGYSYYQLTVFDADGSKAVYRDTGCPELRVAGATALLPHGAFDSFPVDNATSCP
jgi:hypothetical protein